MIVLGINSFLEHPAVALVVDGELVFAAEEERFTRIKHGKRYTPYRTHWPIEAMWGALEFNDLHASDVDEIAYSYNRWDHLMSFRWRFTGKRVSSLRDELSGFISLVNLMPAIQAGYEIPERFKSRLSPNSLSRISFREFNHHRSHAASAYYCSGYGEALVVVCDGSGESECTSVYVGRGRQLDFIARTVIPHSLGFFYSAFTKHLGFEPFSDEFKVMGLAAYGEPRFLTKMSQIVQLIPRGKFTVNRHRLCDLVGEFGQSRRPKDPITQHHMDVAKSVQTQLETTLLHVISHFVKVSGVRKLCLAGGTFLNSVANGVIAESGLVDEIFVQPAAHDAGTAIGAASLSLAYHGLDPRLCFDSACLGTAYDDNEIENVLCDARIPYHQLNSGEIAGWMAERLARGNVGAIFRGRMEFGPRALGMRSILASPIDSRIRDRLNRTKGREDFRPVAPIVTEEAFPEYFVGNPNRYMAFVATARQNTRLKIPAAVHVDGSARVQVISMKEDPFLHELLIKLALQENLWVKT